MPTLVEVKAARDTLLRREVMGQMLDYAANGSRYWPPDLLRSTWQYSLSEGQDPDRVIQEFAGLNAEEFWDKVAANLQDGRVRMLFVSDSISTELQTIIEYLDGRQTATSYRLTQETSARDTTIRPTTSTPPRSRALGSNSGDLPNP